MVNQKAAVCKTQTKSMGRSSLYWRSESVALGDKLGRSSGVDWVIQNWAFSARNAPWRGRREEEGREGFSG
jgi:hypothetical protein